MNKPALNIIVNNPQVWEAFTLLLNEKLEVTRSQLERAVEPHDIYRGQGRVSLIRELQGLRAKVNGTNN
jgi:hypothetical protein